MKTNQLKKFRLAAGLTRKQLAKKSRISEIVMSYDDLRAAIEKAL